MFIVAPLDRFLLVVPAVLEFTRRDMTFDKAHVETYKLDSPSASLRSRDESRRLSGTCAALVSDDES
jgi:hypothetical protein